jgi:dynein heavy chain
VRTNISKLARCTLEALVVLDVHARDVIEKELLQKQVSDVHDFNW